jgi:4-aminobutyrate aminotransferase/(S)-3-amino-2-methylpropionate transaminase
MDSIHVGGLGGTYTGNPVACAAAIAAIGWMKDAMAIELAQRIEEILFEKLEQLQDRFPQIVEVRGRGAMVAIEFAEPGSNAPLPDLAGKVAKYCHENGVVVLVTGTYGNVIRFLPPLSIPIPALQDALGVLGEALAATK